MLLGDANSLDLPLKKTSYRVGSHLQIISYILKKKKNKQKKLSNLGYFPKMKTHVGVGKINV